MTMADNSPTKATAATTTATVMRSRRRRYHIVTYYIIRLSITLILFALILRNLFYAFGSDGLSVLSPPRTTTATTGNANEATAVPAAPATTTTTHLLIDIHHQKRNSSSTAAATAAAVPSSPLVHQSQSISSCQEIGTIILRNFLQSYQTRYTNFTQFLDGPGLNHYLLNQNNNNNPDDDDDDVRDNVCMFFETSTSKHFPHAMQQFYRCWSWFVYQNQNRNRKRNRQLTASSTSSPTQHTASATTNVLVGPKNHRGFKSVHKKHDLFTEILCRLSSRGHIRIETTTTTTNNNINIDTMTTDNTNFVQSHYRDGDNFRMHTTNDATELRKSIGVPGNVDEDDNNNNNNNLNRDWITGCPSTKTTIGMPRIAILNRDNEQSKRSIMNAEALASKLQATFYNNNNNDNYQVPVVYFEMHHTLDYQIQFFNNADIVLSPHGAQLTALAFLPSCGAILEIFPPNYYMPEYFASLAKQSGLGYTAVYLTTTTTTDDTNTVERETKAGMANRAARMKARRSNLCPKLDSLMEIINTMVDDWRNCCMNKKGVL